MPVASRLLVGCGRRARLEPQSRFSSQCGICCCMHHFFRGLRRWIPQLQARRCEQQKERLSGQPDRQPAPFPTWSHLPGGAVNGYHQRCPYAFTSWAGNSRSGFVATKLGIAWHGLFPRRNCYWI